MMHCPDMIEALRQRGYRITPQREMIIQALGSAGDHITAEAIYAVVKDRSNAVNIATVYRTLDTLVAEGLVSRSHHHGGQAVYATQHHGPHLHLFCRQCEMVISVDHELVTPLLDGLVEMHQFEADLTHLSIVGLCAHCQSNGAS